MQVFRFLRRHPLTVLGVFALAFVVWLWRDAISPSEPVIHPDSLQTAQVGPLRRELPRPALDEPVPPPEKARLTPRETVQALSKLKPGMTRAEVEVMVGAPAAQDIHPARVTEGRVTYHTTYEADLGPPSTIRPIRPMPKELVPQPRDRTVITLEYDATKPGHPLLGIFYPDPLF